MWLLPVIVMMSPNTYLETAGKYTPLSLSLSTVSLSLLLHAIIMFFTPSLLLWLCIFLSSPYFVLPAFPLRLLASLLSSPDSPPHQSVFLLPCLCASYMGRNSPSHMGEDQLQGNPGALPKKKLE